MGTSTLDNITAGKYTNHMTYITAGKYTNHMTYERLKKDDQEPYLQRHARFLEEEARLRMLFRSDLEEEFGVSGHPKAALLFEKACDYGHSNGFIDVYHYYADLVELIQGD